MLPTHFLTFICSPMGLRQAKIKGCKNADHATNEALDNHDVDKVLLFWFVGSLRKPNFHMVNAVNIQAEKEFDHWANPIRMIIRQSNRSI